MNIFIINGLDSVAGYSSIANKQRKKYNDLTYICAEAHIQYEIFD